MRRKNWHKRHKRNTHPASPSKTVAPPTTPPIKKGIRWGKIGVGLGIIASMIVILQFFGINGSSAKKNYQDETFEKGVLRPPLIQDSNKYSISEHPFRIINHAKPSSDTPEIKGILIKDFDKQPYHFVFISGFIFTCFTGDFYKGIDIFNPVFNSCYNSHLILGVKDNRLYVSVEFKDLQNEQTIGVIEYNHWKLYKPNLFDFHNDDERLEVIDKQNNIVFSIKYESNMVWIGGYFIGNSSIIVMPNDPQKSKSINPLCIPKADTLWKKKAQEEISVLKSIFI